jgi:hypothetical protein
VKPHDLDAVSLLAGTVFLVIGGVGLLQGAGVVGSGAPWAVIAAIAAVGLTATVVSLRGLVRTPPAASPGWPPAPAESVEPAPGAADDDHADAPAADPEDEDRYSGGSDDTDVTDDDTGDDTTDDTDDEMDGLLADE